MEYKQAPKLICENLNNLKEKNEVVYVIPQNIITAVFNLLDARQGNAIKLMMVLLGTIGNGTFGLSEQFVLNTTGMAHNKYIAARNYLKEKGWITLVAGQTITVNVQNIMAQYHTQQTMTDVTTRNPITDSDVTTRNDRRYDTECTDVTTRNVQTLRHVTHNKLNNKEVINNKTNKDGFVFVSPKKNLFDEATNACCETVVATSQGEPHNFLLDLANEVCKKYYTSLSTNPKSIITLIQKGLAKHDKPNDDNTIKAFLEDWLVNEDWTVKTDGKVGNPIAYNITILTTNWTPTAPTAPIKPKSHICIRCGKIIVGNIYLSRHGNNEVCEECSEAEEAEAKAQTVPQVKETIAKTPISVKSCTGCDNDYYGDGENEDDFPF